MHLNTLKERQEYYQFSERPLRFKEPPNLNADLAQAMKRERLDRAYRFVWGGVVIVREEPNSEALTIARGNKTACHVVDGVLLPKWPFERARQARGYFYMDAVGQKVCTTREEYIPKGYMARVDYRYVDFGLLFWYLEQRANAQQLIDAGIYNAKDLVPEEDWTCVMKMNSKNGLYYEPGLEMIEVLKAREWENENADLKEVARRTSERKAKAQAETDAKEEAAANEEWEYVANGVLRDVERGRKYSIPAAPTVTLSGDGRIVPAERPKFPGQQTT